MSTPGTPAVEPPSPAGGRAHLKERAREELRNYLLVSLYLYICFGIVLIYKSALLEEEGVQFLPHGLAAIKALILGKFILIGEAIGIGSRLRVSTLAMAIAARSIAGFLFLALLSVVEELVVGWVHGKSLATTLADYMQQPTLLLVSESLLLLVALVPLIAAKQIDRRLGPGGLRRLLFERDAGGGRLRDE
jgi:hypothetical protein